TFEGGSASEGFYVDRIVGRNCDYCGPHCTFAPRRSAGARGGPTEPVQKQPETNRVGDVQLREHVQNVPIHGVRMPQNQWRADSQQSDAASDDQLGYFAAPLS